MYKQVFLAATLIVLLPFVSICQESKILSLIDEGVISINQSFVENTNTSNQLGFGAGLNKYLIENENFKLVSGISYDFTSQLKKSVNNGGFSRVIDVSYNFHSISVPLLTRFYLGNSVKFYFETGIFAELNLAANREGNFKTMMSDKEFEEVDRTEKVNIPNPNTGFILGLGSEIPSDRFTLIIKASYQHGLRNLWDFQDPLLNRYGQISIGIKKSN